MEIKWKRINRYVSKDRLKPYRSKNTSKPQESNVVKNKK